MEIRENNLIFIGFLFLYILNSIVFEMFGFYGKLYKRMEMHW